jgi:putative hydrolase of the HAD superfamily
MPVSTVIFDYGEVISLAANQDARREMLQTAALPQELFERHYWDYRDDYDAGVLRGRAYWDRIAASAGTEFSHDQIIRLMEHDARMWMDLNPDMLAWHADLRRAGLRTAILSNMGEEVLKALRRDFSWLNNFDTLVWSCEAGCAKPDAAIYRHAIEKLAIRPEEGLFIDNLEPNIRAAQEAGLQGIVFKNVEQLRAELQERNFDLPLPGAVAV